MDNCENMPCLSSDKMVLLYSAINLDESSKIHCCNAPQVSQTMESQNNECTCEWYHAAWGYCRYAELIRSPQLHKYYFQKVFTELSKKNRINILISGAADFSILDHISSSIDCSQLNNLYFTVVDMCMTPLINCKWYNELRSSKGLPSLNIDLVQTDMLKSGLPDDFFDIITTYRFLSKFNSNDRKKLIEEWKRMLIQGGWIITSESIFPGQGSFWMPTREQISDYIIKAREKIEHTPEFYDRKERIMSIIEKYANNLESQCQSLKGNQELFFLL